MKTKTVIAAALVCAVATVQNVFAADAAAQKGANAMNRIDDLLAASKAFFLATVDGDQPKLRPLGAPRRGRQGVARGRRVQERLPPARRESESRAELITLMPPGEILLDETDNTVYRFSVKDRAGGAASLKDYEGKVLLVVNTATRCGFTPQYEGLEAMYERLKGSKFELLDFPCNQFGQQAPGTDEEIHSFCVLNYKTAFPQFAKVEVNGANAAPLFRFLVASAPFKGFPQDGKLAPILEDMLGKADADYAKKPDIKWNFTKFLIGKDGRVVRRFEPTAPLSEVEEAIRVELAK